MPWKVFFSLKIKCLMVNVMLLSVIQFTGYLYGSSEGTLYLENTLGNSNDIRNYIKG